MRFMIVVKGNEDSEKGVMPSEQMLEAMAKYNEELSKAGVLLDLAGLHPSSKGARVRFSGPKRTVIDGPFTEAKELIAGYWLVQMKSKEEALAWVKRIPFENDEVVELRQVFELEDFAPSPAIDKHRELGKELEKKKGG